MYNKAMEAQCILAEQQLKKRKRKKKFLDAANGFIKRAYSNAFHRRVDGMFDRGCFAQMINKGAFEDQPCPLLRVGKNMFKNRNPLVYITRF